MPKYKVQFEVTCDEKGRASDIEYYLNKYLYGLTLPNEYDPGLVDVEEIEDK